MKTKFTFFCIFLMFSVSSFSQKIIETNYFKNNPGLGGDVVINNSSKEVVGNKSYTSFEINAPSAGSYNLNLWLMPTKLKDGSYSSYDVVVNGIQLSGKVKPNSGYCQSLGLAEGKVSLKQGINTISFVASVPEIADVEFIRLSPVASKAIISSLKYDNFMAATEKMSEEQSLSMEFASAVRDTTLLLETVLPNPEGNYTHEMDYPVQYTYYRTVTFNAGQQIFLATNGVNNFGHILELFSATNPELYSWVTTSNSNCLASLNVTIPVTGMYYVRVRADLNARAGLANLNINGENYYENIPVSSIGIRVTQDNQKVYNTFTCYSTTDPRIWI